MGRTPRVPAALNGRPFSLDEARALGLTPSALRGKSYERVGSRLYALKGVSGDKFGVIQAFARVLPGSAVFIGRTAAWLHGLDLEPTNRVQVALPPPSRLESRAGLEIHHMDVGDEVVRLHGVTATSLDRTLLDLCVLQSPVEALVALDMAVVARLTDKDALRCYATQVIGHRGVARLKSLADHAAPAESPMETRLRWLLIAAGLPPPEVQAELRNDEGGIIGRADLYYPSARLIIEFDGRNHQDRLVSDLRRQNALHHAGYKILRFTSADVYGRPDTVVALVRAALR